MITKLKKVVVFDLDDTLYKELDFVKSSFHEIGAKISALVNVESSIIIEEMLQLFKEKQNVFKTIINKYSTNLSLEDLILLYRNHKPQLQFSNKKEKILKQISDNKISIGLLTDGRSIQQRNKIAALGIDKYLDKIIISEEFGSEKPCKNNYLVFEDFFIAEKYFYIADNTKKDFITPNKLGWDTICLLDNGNNIHTQNFSLPKEYLPKYKITSFDELQSIILY